MSVLRSFFLAGYTSSIPALVGRSQIGRANSYFEAIYSTGYIVGPAIAGILATTIGPGQTLAIDAVSFALSGLGLIFVHRDLRAPVDRVHGPILAEIRVGITYIRQDPVLRSAILFWGSISIVFAPLVTALAVHITRDLHEEPAVLGLVLAAYGLGTVVGALLMARRGAHGRVAPVLLGGSFVIAVGLILLAITSEVPVMLAIAVVAGVSQSLVLLTYITLRTVYSPDELLGRIGSTARVVSLGLQPIGLLVGGALIDLTSGSTVLAIMGVTVAAVILAFLPVRALRTATLQPRPA
jgi:predicted MFS family arabinose efflux permease